MRNSKIYIPFFFIILISPILFVWSQNLSANYFINIHFDINLQKYFYELIKYHHFFIGGKESINEFIYLPFFGIEYIFSFLFHKQSLSYLFTILIYIGIGYFSFVSLLKEFELYFSNKKISSKYSYFIYGFVSLLYFSSLSVFQMWKGNFFEVSAYFIFPFILYHIIKLFKKFKVKNFIYLFIGILLLYPTNFTYIVLSIISYNLFLLVIFLYGYKENTLKNFIKKVLIINIYILILLLPYLYILLSQYIGNHDIAVKSVSSENFYSNNASILNILTQTNFWGLFGSWNGQLRYDFSKFYLHKSIYIFGIFLFIYILFLIIKTKYINKKQNIFIYGLFSIILFYIYFSLGFHSSIYNFLYEYSNIFKIFRNVTKIQGFLFFFVYFLLGILLLLNQKNNKLFSKFYILPLFIIFLYNIPYYTYNYSFNNKFLLKVPNYWNEMGKYVNTNIKYNEKILILPKFYSIGDFIFNGKRFHFEGFMGDMFFNTKTYRLNEGFIGNPKIASAFLNMQYKCDTNIRKKCTNKKKFIDFINNFNIRYVLITNDSINEYDSIEFFKSILTELGFKKIKQYGKLELYFKK